jgi:hypothetical protein
MLQKVTTIQVERRANEPLSIHACIFLFSLDRSSSILPIVPFTYAYRIPIVPRQHIAVLPTPAQSHFSPAHDQGSQEMIQAYLA